MSDDRLMAYFPATFKHVVILQDHDENDYELIIEDWQRVYLGEKYVKVERLGGPGDKSRDILCTDNNDDLWIYQCKYYSDAISKNEIFPEVAKCCYYCYKQEYKVKGVPKTPKKYYFVSPKGVTIGMRDLFEDPTRLKSELIAAWATLCKKRITKTEEVLLEGELSSYINNFDFSIFYHITPEEFVEDYKKSPNFSLWLGKFVKPKKEIEVPKDIQDNETEYIKKVFDAYGDYLGQHIDTTEQLKLANPSLLKNFENQRRYFYSAEYLVAVSRDSHAAEFHWWDHLKHDFYEGIIQTVEDDAEHGFERLKKVLDRACVICPSLKNPLTHELDIDQRKGMCHELANEYEEIRWTTKTKKK